MHTIRIMSFLSLLALIANHLSAQEEFYEPPAPIRSSGIYSAGNIFLFRDYSGDSLLVKLDPSGEEVNTCLHADEPGGFGTCNGKFIIEPANRIYLALGGVDGSTGYAAAKVIILDEDGEVPDSAFHGLPYSNCMICYLVNNLVIDDPRDIYISGASDCDGYSCLIACKFSMLHLSSLSLFRLRT